MTSDVGAPSRGSTGTTVCVSTGPFVVDATYMDADADGDREGGDDEDEEKEILELTTSA